MSCKAKMKGVLRIRLVRSFNASTTHKRFCISEMPIVNQNINPNLHEVVIYSANEIKIPRKKMKYIAASFRMKLLFFLSIKLRFLQIEIVYPTTSLFHSHYVFVQQNQDFSKSKQSASQFFCCSSLVTSFLTNVLHVCVPNSSFDAPPYPSGLDGYTSFHFTTLFI